MSKKLPLLLVFALLLAGGVFWLVGQKTVTPTVSVEEPRQTTETTQEPVQTVDTSDWKTYRNENHNFQISYPADWYIKEHAGENSDPSVVSFLSPETRKLLQEGKTDHSCDISIYHYMSVSDEPENRTKKKSLEAMMKENHAIQPIGYDSLGIWPATKVIWGGDGASYTLLAETKDGLYKASFCSKDKEENLTSIEKKVLTSVRPIR